ncbi:phage head spike fiber domain-containing protein [Aeromonas caviae]|uniref:phage head spike fiber domain-containing protein n=1 Tax=Aeromonas caviae TaxID=648 RepID=UPI0021E75734|nr:hypothetical protein [Aeromonas caviae]MCV3281819.1 hypothetical protein [Aeromonas caviae]
MAGLWQRTGNVTVTNGSKIVTGFGTKWKTGTLPIQKGHAFYGPDNAAYEVDTVVSDTEILLVDTYRGGTLANQPYRIDITRTSTISQFAADLASLVAKYRSWFDGMMTWLTGSGDVAILNPDTGANVTIPSWKKVASEGEGQAARAKTEADKAASSAALAGDIVAASALPLPDVWAPLSDNLRMITGYGRDVLVGSDVVARMVNFSRSSTATYIGKDGQLKTAAVNEPRFEKEGLLIEGQSTNLVIRSADMTQSPWSGNNAGTGVLPIVTGNYAVAPDGSQSATRLILNKGAGTTGVDSATMSCPLNTTVGSTYTLSVWLKSTDGVSQPKVSLSFNGESLAVITVTGEWRRYQITTPSATDANRFPRLQLRGGTGTSDTADILVWGWQQEALPIASSYIPTNGAAVTRAMDKPLIPVKMNEATKVQTCAIELNIPIVNMSAYRWILQGSYVSLSMANSGHIRGWDFAATVVAGPARAGRSVIAQRITDASRSVFNNGVGFTVSNTGDLGGYFPYDASVLAIGWHINFALYGHVRNLRIWHRDLGDTQIKAIA